MEQTPKLEPKDLFEKRIKRDQARLKVYNQILTQIYQRIYKLSQINGNTTHILFTVPPFIIGMPMIDLQDCIVYLVYMLRQNKYEVRYTYPNLLFISWRQHEKDYMLTQSPIMKTMLPVSEPVSTKKRTGHTLISNANGNTIVSGSSSSQQQSQTQKRVTFSNDTFPQSSQQQPQRRSTTDYQPPNTFVQSLQAPSADKKNDLLSSLWAFS